MCVSELLTDCEVGSAFVEVRVLWLCGADAAGKSTVGWEIYSRLTSSGRAAAYLDIDYLGFCTPQPGGDPTWLVERNLAAMWATFAEAGARFLVAAGVDRVQRLYRALDGLETSPSVAGFDSSRCRISRVACHPLPPERGGSLHHADDAISRP